MMEGRANVCVDDKVDYEAVVSAINEGVLILQEGKILYANEALCAIIGRSQSDLLGSPFSDLVSGDEGNKIEVFLQRAGRGEFLKEGMEFRLENEPQKTVEMKVSLIHCHGREAVLAAMSDVTERRKERIETQRLHGRLRSIIDSMRHVVLSFSYSEEASKAKVRDAAFYDKYLVEINPAAEALYGVPRSDFLNKKRSIFDYVYWEDREKVLSHYNNLYEEGIGELTYRVVGPNREIRWVLDYGRVEYLEKGRVRRVNHIIEDITTEKKAQDELRASEEKYRRIFERSRDMIYIMTSDGTFIDINPAGVELLGLSSKEEAASRNMKEFHVDPTVRDALVREMIEKGEVTKSRVMLKNKTEEIIEVDLNVIARRDETGKVVSYQGIVHNITEAIRQKELEAIGQLAGCFADDLASPLTVTMMGINATGDFLRDLKVDIDRLLNPAEAVKAKEIGEGIREHFGEIVYFNNEALLACKDMKERLAEIREQYWKLKKVSDGAGGMIYERGSRKANVGYRRG
jgi:PAS domain S-box-containing protein